MEIIRIHRVCREIIVVLECHWRIVKKKKVNRKRRRGIGRKEKQNSTVFGEDATMATRTRVSSDTILTRGLI
jgi:hypothetical protein